MITFGGRLNREIDSFSSCTEAVQLAERTLIAAGIDSPRFEAQLLVACAMGVDRSAVIARTAPDPNHFQRSSLLHMLSERSRRVPLAYLRGTQEFYGLPFSVSPATLIPRPESEMLVDFALEAFTSPDSARTPVLVDIGTGSGCIAVAALVNRLDARAIAVDLSVDALAMARLNAEQNGVSARIRFVQTNVLAGIGRGVNLIVSNPPYIPSQDIEALQPEVAIYEPRLALDGGSDGLAILRRIVVSASFALVAGGWLAVECACGQARSVADLFKGIGFESCRIVPDLAGIERLVCGMRPR